MSTFAFDQCPVELILLIFQYLSGNDIVLAFYNTSSYMNSIMKSYRTYSLNFISITRTKFHSILSNVELKNIVSLTLSDGELTGGQFGLFLSRYHELFHLFNSLQCLTLHCIHMKKNEYDLLVEALKQWKNLRMLHLNQISLLDVNDRFTTAFDQLDSRCLVKFDYCDQLNVMRLSNRLQYWALRCLYDIDNSFYRQQWLCLRAVKLKDLWRTSINHLLQLTPQLLSLIVDCEIDKTTSPPNFRLVPNLKQLMFSCQNLSFHSFIVQTGLDTLSKLKHLEIRCSTSTDELILNGYQWESFLSKSFRCLLKFDLHLKYSPQRKVSLNTFRTRFWLEEKKWFVALAHGQYSTSWELLTLPRFNTTMKTSRSIIDTTLPSSKHPNPNVHDELSLDYHRYQHIEIFDLIIEEKSGDPMWFFNELHCLLNLNSIRIVKFDVMCCWIVNYQQIFDLLECMPNLSKIILDTWPKKESWAQIKKGNARVTSIELPVIHQQFPSGLKQLFSHVFPSIEHVHMRIHSPELCYQFDQYSLPWKTLSSLQLKYLFVGNTIDDDEDQEKRCHIWKEKFLDELLPEQSRRTFTFVDVDNKLSIWFGDIIDNNPGEKELIEEETKKTTKCFPFRKCLLS